MINPILAPKVTALCEDLLEFSNELKRLGFSRVEFVYKALVSLAVGGLGRPLALPT
jgi:hypothetical protein